MFSTRMTVAVAALVVLAQVAVAQAPKDDTLAKSDAEMRPVLTKLAELGAKPVEQLSEHAAREQPTPADAVKAVLKDQGKDAASLAAAMKLTTKDVTYPNAGGTQPIRIYTPADAKGPLPVIVYFHGGGWVIADIKTYESSAMALARKANAIVASVEYRKGPEAPFPAAHEDAYKGYKWVVENAKSLNGDPTRIAVVGESAGGNLALNVAIKARDEKFQAPLHIVAVYPVAGTDLNTASYKANEDGKPLSKKGIEWFVSKYLVKPADKESPMINLYAKADLKGLPSVSIINAELDVLASDGELLEAALKKAGVEVTRQLHTGVVHEFFGMDAVLSKADIAQKFAAEQLTKAFNVAQAAAAAPASDTPTKN